MDQAMPCSASLPGGGDHWDTQGFLLELDTAGRTVFSTFIGGVAYNTITGLTAQKDGTVLITGAGLGALTPFPTDSTLLAAPGTAIYQDFTLLLDPARIRRGLPAPSCLVDGVNFSPGRIARGSFATLFGSGLGPDIGEQSTITGAGVPNSAGGTQVTVDGTPVFPSSMRKTRR